MLAEIRQEQNIAKNESIDQDKVSDGLLEELGEAGMSYMIPNPGQHEWMDEMMGGMFESGSSGWGSMMGSGFGRSMMGSGQNALGILNQRYAGGEIDRAEYQKDQRGAAGQVR